MGEFRDYRLTIPSGVFVLTVLALFLEKEQTRQWMRWQVIHRGESLTPIAALLGFAFASFALGYIISLLPVALINGLAFWSHCRGPLRRATVKWYPTALRLRLLARSSIQNLAIHGYAPKGYVEYLTRRSTAMHVSAASSMAIVMGALCADRATSWLDILPPGDHVYTPLASILLSLAAAVRLSNICSVIPS